MILYELRETLQRRACGENGNDFYDMDSYEDLYANHFRSVLQ